MKKHVNNNSLNKQFMLWACLSNKGRILARPGTPLDDLDPFSLHLKIDQQVRSKFHGPLEFYETWNA